MTALTDAVRRAKVQLHLLSRQRLTAKSTLFILEREIRDPVFAARNKANRVKARLKSAKHPQAKARARLAYLKWIDGMKKDGTYEAWLVRRAMLQRENYRRKHPIVKRGVEVRKQKVKQESLRAYRTKSPPPRKAQGHLETYRVSSGL